MESIDRNQERALWRERQNDTVSQHWSYTGEGHTAEHFRHIVRKAGTNKGEEWRAV